MNVVQWLRKGDEIAVHHGNAVHPQTGRLTATAPFQSKFSGIDPAREFDGFVSVLQFLAYGTQR
ncbi:MAG: hypothetical protein ACR2O4_06460, partial [Hyphomicrobiaceae bacterium]